MNWYKIAGRRGLIEPLMDEYSRGEKPLSSDHRKDEKSLVTHNPILGGDTRDGYPDDMKTFEERPSEEYKNRRRLPGESVLMDQDPPTGEGVNKDQFVDPGDRIPKGPNDNSARLDKGYPPIRQDLYKRIRDRTRLKMINRI